MTKALNKTRKSSVALTPEMLRQATTGRYYHRGEEYFEIGLVKSLKEKDGKIHATVHGSHPYKTTLWLEDGMAGGQCTCPLGREGEFCKHLVATGLTWIEAQASGDTRQEQKAIQPADIEAWLQKQPPEKLVETIMSQAMSDDEFYNVLKFRVAADQPAANTKEMRAVLRQAMTIHDFISWRETSAYSRGVGRVLDRIKAMLKKSPQEVMELAEYGMELWEKAIDSIDDSDGCMGIILDDLHQLHLAACQLAKPDPVVLADRLFDRHVNSGWDIFHGAYKTYGSVLGKTGQARYRERVESEWRKLPSYGPGAKNEDRYGRSNRIDRMMLDCAEESGDLDRIIEVMSRDLSEPHHFLAIARRCRTAGRHDLARQWAEQGLKTFPEHHRTGLHDFLAEEYLHDKRPEDAVGVIWETFQQSPSLERYGALAQYAAKAKAWPEWREKALAHIRNQITQPRKSAGNRYDRWAHKPDHSLLVEIFLWEKDADAAWDEAQKGGCSESLWLQLAKTRENDHPEDAIVIYRRQVEPQLERKNNQSYQTAVDYLDKIHALMTGMSKEAEFNQYLLTIKTEWKRLRNFIKYLEQKKWGKT
jgi:uncharacterized Zn finger protein